MQFRDHNKDVIDGGGAVIIKLQDAFSVFYRPSRLGTGLITQMRKQKNILQNCYINIYLTIYFSLSSQYLYFFLSIYIYIYIYICNFIFITGIQCCRILWKIILHIFEVHTINSGIFFEKKKLYFCFYFHKYKIKMAWILYIYIY